MEETKIQILDGFLLKVEKVIVKKIEIRKPSSKNKNKFLYNLTIEEDNSFVLNTIITHNTGERGYKEWRQWFEEKKPNYTIPIVPLKAKAMHFTVIELIKTDTKKGYKYSPTKHVFLKQSKGQSPQAWMRRAFYDSKPYMNKIWKKEFSNGKMGTIIKIKNV